MATFLYPLPKEYYDQTTDDPNATKFYGSSYHGAHTYWGHGTGKLDLCCKNGTPVRAMTDGIVIRAGKDNFGNHISMQILVQGTFGSYTMENQGYVGKDGIIGGLLIIRYYHIGQYQFSVGDRVKQGDIIGYVGDSSVTSTPHLHLDFTYSMSHNDLMPPYGALRGAPDPDTISEYNAEQKAAVKRWYKDEKKPGRCWEVIVSEAVWKEAAGGTYSGDVNTFKAKLQEFNNKYRAQIPGGAITLRFADVTPKLYNQLILNGANPGAACCILANGYEENLVNCIDSQTREITWGSSKAVGGTGKDCGIWAFHSGGDAYNDIVISKIFPPSSLSTWGFTQNQVAAGKEDVQAAYITAIMNQSDKIKTNGSSRYKLVARTNIKVITDPITGRKCSGRLDLQKQYVNGNFNDFFSGDLDLGTGALLMERLFEGSAQLGNSLARRVATAWAFGYIFMGLKL